MKYQKKTSVGNWIKAGEDFKDGAYLKIASEGQQVQGTFGMQDVFLMKTQGGKEGNLALNQTSINNLVDAYGEESITWVGKVVKVWLIRQMVSGAMKNVVYLTHPSAEMIEDAAGFRWEVKGAQAPAEAPAPVKKPAGYPTEEINPDDIPF